MAETAKSYVRRHLIRRLSFVTYVRTIIAQFYNDGSPILAPTSVYYPQDLRARHTPNQFMWGYGILVGTKYHNSLLFSLFLTLCRKLILGDHYMSNKAVPINQIIFQVWLPCPKLSRFQCISLENIHGDTSTIVSKSILRRQDSFQ